MTLKTDFYAYLRATLWDVPTCELSGHTVVVTAARAIVSLLAAHAALRTLPTKRPHEGLTRDELTAAVVPYLRGLEDWEAERLAGEAIAYAVESGWIKPVVRERRVDGFLRARHFYVQGTLERLR